MQPSSKPPRRRNTPAPLVVLGEAAGEGERSSLSDQVLELLEKGEPELADALLNRAGAQIQDARNEHFAASLLLRDAAVRRPARRALREPEAAHG